MNMEAIFINNKANKTIATQYKDAYTQSSS
jgi:hypothetical protein